MLKWSKQSKSEKILSIIMIIACIIVIPLSICSWFGIVRFSYPWDTISLFISSLVMLMSLLQYKWYNSLTVILLIVAIISMFIAGLIPLIAHFKN